MRASTRVFQQVVLKVGSLEKAGVWVIYRRAWEKNACLFNRHLLDHG